MKANLFIKLNLGIVILLFLLSSCNRSIDGIQIVREKKTKQTETIVVGKSKHQIKESKIETQFDSLIADKKSKEETLTASTEISNPELKNEIPSITKNNSDDFKIDWSANNLEECDIIVLKTGEEVSAKVTEIGQDEIKYKKCDNLSGPTYSMNKSLVFMIKYSNGTKDIISSDNSTQNNSSPQKSPTPNNDNSKNDLDDSNGNSVWGIISFVVGLVGLLVLPIPFGVVAMIFGGIGVNKKLKGLAITGLILGFIDLIVGLILLALALSYY